MLIYYYVYIIYYANSQTEMNFHLLLNIYVTRHFSLISYKGFIFY